MSIKSFLYKRRPELAIASEFYGASRDFRKAGFGKTCYGFMMRGPSFMLDGSYENAETEIIIKYMKDADVFVDVGANMGYYICMARSLDLKVIAVEPLWHNLQYIYANLEANNWLDVEVFPVGLSDQPGVAVLYGVGTAASLIKDWAGISTKKRMVPLTTLDIIVGKRFSNARLLVKIDVEGVEFSVLKGALEIMSLMPPPVWVVEAGLTGHYPGKTNPDFPYVFETFWSMGYEAYSMKKKGEEIITEKKIQNWIRNSDTEEQFNFLFKKR